MTELDFDELDKAVNSLMGDKKEPVGSVPASPPQDATPAATPATPATPAPVASEPASTPSQVPSSQSVRPTPMALRRSGRFMDVVPAVRKDPASATKPPVSRQGATLQPSSPVVEPEPLKTAETAPPPQAPAATEPPTTDWPDPLELVSKNTSDAENPLPEASSIEEAATPALKELEWENKASDVKNTTDEPLSSPFLPDAKVEKRPLGGALPAPESPLLAEDGNTQLPALPKDVEPALPEELHGDVVSIEADNSTTDPSRHAAPEPSVPEVKRAEMPAPKEVKPAVTVTEAAAPTGPTSIPQQYKEESATGDTKNGAIYDTKSYHQPLSHPAKKKSGWGWVLWILLILVLGAGGGAALYLLGIF